MSWKDVLKEDPKELHDKFSALADKINSRPEDKMPLGRMEFVEHDGLLISFDERKKEILLEGTENVFTDVYQKLIHRFEPQNPVRMVMLRELENMEKAFEKIDNKKDWNKQADKFASFLMMALNNIFDTIGSSQSAWRWLKEKDFYME